MKLGVLADEVGKLRIAPPFLVPAPEGIVRRSLLGVRKLNLARYPITAMKLGPRTMMIFTGGTPYPKSGFI
jgi:hypothetical protein